MREYTNVIKDLRCLQKLSRQLPTIVFLPMFEVGVKGVKDEIQRRIDALLQQVFDSYESGVIEGARVLCKKYEGICSRLSKPLATPADVVHMEKYKGELLVDMGRL